MDVNNLIEKLRTAGRDDIEINQIRKACEFASKAHRGQKRKSGEDYISHPLTIALRLAEMKLDTATIMAAILHDVCEDTDVTLENLRKNFGDEIAFLVEGVTKLDKIRFKGTERSAESLRKMFLAVAEDIRVVLIKLTDRLHNMETLHYLPEDKQKRVALETLEIYAPLAYRLGMTELSGNLEDLAFPYVYPKEHEWLTKNTQDQYANLDNYLQAIKPVLAKELINEKIPFLNILARAKHKYSLYKKMLRYDLDVSKITDIVALRVIVPNIEDCYATLGAVHKLWRPLPGKIKDYIAMPKPNGYRSLHTTVFGPEGKPVEIQMRTEEMHGEAENGIAAHWAYSELKRKDHRSYAQKKPSLANQNHVVWIQQLREWQKEFEKPDEFLESLKIDFFKNRIFVLTPKGDVFDLPEGSTPVDFAYHVHTEIGNKATGAKVNGKMVSLDYQLKNGDWVEVLTQKNKKANPDWLQFVKSVAAKKKISSVIRKEAGAGLFVQKKGELIELQLSVQDRVGLLRDVSNVLAKKKINMKSVTTDSKNRAWPLLVIQAPFRNRIELEKTMVSLKEVKGVKEVGYKLVGSG